MTIDELLKKFELPADTLANLRTPVFAKALYADEGIAGEDEETLQHLRTEYLARTNRLAEIAPAWIAEAAEQARANTDCNVRRMIRVVCDSVMLRVSILAARTDVEATIEVGTDSVMKLRRDLLVCEVSKQSILHVQRWKLEAVFDITKLAGIETWQALACAAR